MNYHSKSSKGLGTLSSPPMSINSFTITLFQTLLQNASNSTEFNLPTFNDKLNIFTSAILIFFEPSDLSRIGGMHCASMLCHLGREAHPSLIQFLSTQAMTRRVSMAWMLHVHGCCSSLHMTTAHAPVPTLIGILM